MSESLQVRIVAGRPIHCQVPGIDHHLVSRAAVRATLEAAKAIALSHMGTLFIAETDERRINRIQQVSESVIHMVFYLCYKRVKVINLLSVSRATNVQMLKQ